MHVSITNTATNQVASVIPDNWKQVKDTYTCDEVLDAYAIGKKEGQNAVFDLMKEKFQTNVNRAAEYCERVITFLESNNMDCYSAHLKPTPPFKFEATLIVGKEHFFTEKFDEVYEMTHEISVKENSSTFKIYFYFIPQTDHLNERRLIGDGYILAYSPDGKNKALRPR